MDELFAQVDVRANFIPTRVAGVAVGGITKEDIDPRAEHVDKV